MVPEPAAGPADLLAGSAWRCGATPAGVVGGPDALVEAGVAWVEASVPGTAAGAVVAAGRPEPTADELDGADWWFTTRFSGSPGPARLELDGLATLSDVWLNGVHVARGTSMFAPARLPVTVEADNELVVRCAALSPHLAARRPRPRWRTRGASHQNLRFVRTTLLGRQPGWVATPPPVGPYRALRLVPAGDPAPVEQRLACRYDPTSREGRVAVSVTLAPDAPRPTSATVAVGGVTAPLEGGDGPEGWTLTGTVVVPDPDLWWPHTHGTPHRYSVVVDLDGRVRRVGHVGFRTVAVERADERFALVVNGVPVFCRGGCWYPPDPVAYAPDPDDVRSTLATLVAGGHNMVRVTGGTVYEEPAFFEACDELGLLVWQDIMLAFLDPPDDPEVTAAVAAEADRVVGELAGRACLAVVCGSQEVEEQPAMFGLPREAWATPLVHEALAAVVGQRVPDVPYLASSPTGGLVPFQPRGGVSHYCGVGMFMRPLDDLRRAAPTFVSEGLAFSIPPEPATVDERCGGARMAGHDPGWKRAVHHDTGGSWDLEDVRHFYVRELFGVDPLVLRRVDPERLLDLGRAAVSEVMAAAAAEWRRGGSPCEGVLLVGLRDLRVGAGWGVVDALGRPKAPWYALARAFAPIAVLATDEGLNGLDVHLVNDTATAVGGRLRVELFSARHLVEEGSTPVEVPARGSLTVPAGTCFDGFRDLTDAYRFGLRAFELVRCTLLGEDGTELGRWDHLPGAPARDRQHDVGLQGEVLHADGEVWSLRVTTRDLATHVAVEAAGYRPGDGWFHLPPGGDAVVPLSPERAGARPPRVRIRALNSVVGASASG